MVESTVKQPIVRRQVNKLTGVGVNLWLASNAINDIRSLRMGPRQFALNNKKSRQHYYRRGSLLNYEQLLLAGIKL